MRRQNYLDVALQDATLGGDGKAYAVIEHKRR